jgi:hypothetical protein
MRHEPGEQSRFRRIIERARAPKLVPEHWLIIALVAASYAAAALALLA